MLVFSDALILKYEQARKQGGSGRENSSPPGKMCWT